MEGAKPTPLSDDSLAAPGRTTILLVRHGDRYDYANEERWAHVCKHTKDCVINPADPPLSALGHEQARSTAAVLKEHHPTHILVSPYLRVVQTAQPLAHALNIPLLLEEGLAEFKHTPGTIPGASFRFATFPEIDVYHEQIHTFRSDAPREDVLGYMRRMIQMARQIPKRFGGCTVACYSHAASVALVQALTGNPKICGPTLAPCGIWKLVSDDAGATWSVEMEGGDNRGHVADNAPTTFPWGFQHCKGGGPGVEDEMQVLWSEARQLEGVQKRLGVCTADWD